MVLSAVFIYPGLSVAVVFPLGCVGAQVWSFQFWLLSHPCTDTLGHKHWVARLPPQTNMNTARQLAKQMKDERSAKDSRRIALCTEL